MDDQQNNFSAQASTTQVEVCGCSQGETNNRKASRVVISMVLAGTIALSAVIALWWFGHTLVPVLESCALLVLLCLLIITIGFRANHAKVDAIHMPHRSRDEAKESSLDWWPHTNAQDRDEAIRVALIAQHTAESKRIAAVLIQQGYGIHLATDAKAVLNAVKSQPDDWNFLIVDLDLFDDLDDIVDALVDFRIQCVNIPVLLVSSSVKRDELSNYRRAIGDVTLRKPVLRSRLLFGINVMKSKYEAPELLRVLD
jgi:CheY-like chemotaxis protein